jgi:mRNA interferase RelE/StbE
VIAYTLIWRRPAMAGFARIRAADPQLAKAVRAAVAVLADDAMPSDSTPLGTAGLRRLRVGDARIMYQVDESGQTIQILTVGRAGKE